MIEYIKFWLAQMIVGAGAAFVYLVLLTILLLIPVALNGWHNRRWVHRKMVRELTRTDSWDDNWRNETTVIQYVDKEPGTEKEGVIS